MLESQAVVDADGAEAGRLDERPEVAILQVRRTEDPAASVEVEVHARCCVVGREQAQVDLTAACRYRDVARLREELGRREDAAARAPLGARELGRKRLGGRELRLQLLELGVERACLGEDGTVDLGEHAATLRRDRPSRTIDQDVLSGLPPTRRDCP